jgi:putative ABC transport system ATP-binding protein
MIIAKRITKDYRRGNRSFCALDDVSLTIRDDEHFVAFVGESGSGKTTLFNILGGLDEPTKGEVTISGENISALSHVRKARFRNAQIGYIFQAFYLDDSYDVIRNVELPLIIGGIKKSKRKEKVEQVLKDVGMADKASVRVTDLSGGERQRVSIARAIVNDPSIILADEPCGNLDSANGENIMNLLKLLSNSNRTILLITHNRSHAQYAGRIVTLKDGKIVEDAYS